MTVGEVNEVYKRIQGDDAVRYAVGAMQPIDPGYTQNTFREGDRVQAQLAERLPARAIAVAFRYQGSTTNDTHIRAHSDLDILVLHERFFSLEPPLKPQFPYEGDPLEDLRELREASVQVLRSGFPAVTVDTSGGKCISLTGGSLRRKIDVVPANWWNTISYDRSGYERDRGVMIYDAKSHTRITNRPFLHNFLIDQRDNQVGGGVRKVARLLKSLKYDAAAPVQVSSYDICALAYSMPEDLVRVRPPHELLLVSGADRYLRFLLNDAAFRGNLVVPNGSRKIFGSDGASVDGVARLQGEVASLLSDIERGVARSFKNLAEARVEY